MELYWLVFLAIGLSVDSFAVSVSCGLILNEITFKKALRIAFFLSLFQAVMPVLGWFIGNKLETYIREYDHWLAFGLLSLIGLKMIIESFKSAVSENKTNPLELRVLLWLSLATSIDALIVGVGFSAVSDLNLFLTATIIGFTTGVFSMLGILFGKKTGVRFGKNMEIIGGVILISIGVKILLDHIYFGA